MADPDEVAKARTWLAPQAPSDQQLAKVLEALYPDAFLAGGKDGVDQLGAAVSDFGLSATVSATDWSAWTPGSPAVADLVKNGGLQTLLDAADVTIKGINGTTLDRLASILADSIRSGDNMATTAKALSEVVDDAGRAALIATTETNRAMSAGSLAAYREAGIEQWEWLTAAGACPMCEEIADEGPYDVSDDGPPAHPACRCSPSPIVVVGGNEAPSDGGDVTE